MGAGGPVVVAGHSQGGHAALFAGQLAASWAPELDVAGTVAVAPAGDLRTLIGAAFRIEGVLGFALMAAYGWSEAYADAPLDAILTDEAIADMGVMEEGCTSEVQAAFDRPVDDVVASDPLTTQPWGRLVEENSAGGTPTDVPVLVVQGDADTLVPEASNAVLTADLCAGGTVVDYRVYPGAGHVDVVGAAEADVVEWLDGRRSGAPAADGCPDG